MYTTVEKIREIIKNADTVVDLETLENDVSLQEQGIDSLDMTNIFLLIEETYALKIPSNNLDQLKTIDDIVAYLQTK